MTVIEIEDARDPRLADFLALTDVALRHFQQTEHGLYIAESKIVFERAVAVGHRPRAVLALGTALDEAQAVLEHHGIDDVPIFTGPSSMLTSITGYQLHRGLIASMERPPLPTLEQVLEGSRRIVVIEGVVDPTNVGLIFRSTAGIGADAILITPRTADPYYRRSIRVSMGTILQIPWTRVGGWRELGPRLKADGFSIAALALEDGAVSLDEFALDPPERLALVFGSEGYGLSNAALNAADSIVTIPMAHGIDSLNVAASSAVAMWALRTRQ